jgi:hypothetical protein
MGFERRKVNACLSPREVRNRPPHQIVPHARCCGLTQLNDWRVGKPGGTAQVRFSDTNDRCAVQTTMWVLSLGGVFPVTTLVLE